MEKTIEIKFRNKEELDRLQEKLKNPQKMLESIGNYLVSVISESFENEKSPDGKAWKPLSQTVKNSKKERMRKLRALEKGEDYKRKILHESGTLAQDFKPHVEGNKLTIGTNLIYAAIHQFGGQAGRGKKVTIPARPYLPISEDNLLEETEKEILEMVREYLDK
jgi:phage virion morphogenesis protein